MLLNNSDIFVENSLKTLYWLNIVNVLDCVYFCVRKENQASCIFRKRKIELALAGG